MKKLILGLMMVFAVIAEAGELLGGHRRGGRGQIDVMESIGTNQFPRFVVSSAKENLIGNPAITEVRTKASNLLASVNFEYPEQKKLGDVSFGELFYGRRKPSSIRNNLYGLEDVVHYHGSTNELTHSNLDSRSSFGWLVSNRIELVKLPCNVLRHETGVHLTELSGRVHAMTFRDVLDLQEVDAALAENWLKDILASLDREGFGDFALPERIKANTNSVLAVDVDGRNFTVRFLVNVVKGVSVFRLQMSGQKEDPEESALHVWLITTVTSKDWGRVAKRERRQLEKIVGQVKLLRPTEEELVAECRRIDQDRKSRGIGLMLERNRKRIREHKEEKPFSLDPILKELGLSFEVAVPLEKCHHVGSEGPWHGPSGVILPTSPLSSVFANFSTEVCPTNRELKTVRLSTKTVGDVEVWGKRKAFVSQVTSLLEKMCGGRFVEAQSYSKSEYEARLKKSIKRNGKNDFQPSIRIDWWYAERVPEPYRVDLLFWKHSGNSDEGGTIVVEIKRKDAAK